MSPTLLLAALSAPAAAADPFTWDPLVDSGLALSGLGLYGLLYTQVEATLPPGQLGGEPRGVDAWVSPRYVEAWGARSDVLLYGSMLGALGAVGAEAQLGGEAWGPRLGIMSQTLALDLLLTDTLKLATSRPRPYTRLDAADPELLASRDATLSFPSGHASATAAASFGWARMTQISRGVSPALAYPLAGGLTAAVASMRVAAGMHYPSDVLAGALLGASVGLLVPSLHRREGSPALTGVAAAPGLLTLGGRW